FSKSNQYPTIGLVFCLIMYLLLGIYGIYIIHKNEDNFCPVYKH
ncbi:MAG: CPBP family intramembrane metalloprotease, partial [Lachnospiraceae bacterium]|nr:CPBP family intramembrane metalloprotease [Lachnospiraceae bacterium]